VHTLVTSLGGEEPQILMLSIVNDLCVIFNTCDGAPLDYPVFTLFTKCLLLELLQFSYSTILDNPNYSSKENEAAGENVGSSTT